MVDFSRDRLKRYNVLDTAVCTVQQLNRRLIRISCSELIG